MNNKLIIWSSWTMGFSALVISLFLLIGQKKAAYVRSQDLVYKYQGMIDATASFEAKKNAWQSNIDTLRRDFQKHLNWFQANSNTFSSDELNRQQQLLKKQQEDLYNYTGQLQEKVEREEEELLQGVLNQVNSFAESYGRQKGYDLIFGTTLSGSILYGDNTMDITNEVLAELNKQYKGRGIDD